MHSVARRSDFPSSHTGRFAMYDVHYLCRARYDSGWSCPPRASSLLCDRVKLSSVLTMSLSFRSNVNYIPPPQEVSSLSCWTGSHLLLLWRPHLYRWLSNPELNSYKNQSSFDDPHIIFPVWSHDNSISEPLLTIWPSHFQQMKLTSFTRLNSGWLGGIVANRKPRCALIISY